MTFGGDNFFGIEDLSLGQAMFMAEEEGQTDIVDTRRAKIMQICTCLDALHNLYPNANPYEHIDHYIDEAGLNPEELTMKERNIIDAHIF